MFVHWMAAEYITLVHSKLHPRQLPIVVWGSKRGTPCFAIRAHVESLLGVIGWVFGFEILKFNYIHANMLFSKCTLSKHPMNDYGSKISQSNSHKIRANNPRGSGADEALVNCWPCSRIWLINV